MSAITLTLALTLALTLTLTLTHPTVLSLHYLQGGSQEQHDDFDNSEEQPTDQAGSQGEPVDGFASDDLTQPSGSQDNQACHQCPIRGGTIPLILPVTVTPPLTLTLHPGTQAANVLHRMWVPTNNTARTTYTASAGKHIRLTCQVAR